MTPSLIERLESATGPSFDLNAAIAGEDWYREEFGDCADDEVPNFSGCATAAMTLMRPGWGMSMQGNTDVWYAVVFGQYSKACRTPGLAISAAALKARSQP